jgi:uncharacterized protein (DUF1499 family)
MFSSRRPTNLGVHDGRLAPCKPTPNCVSSQADQADALHYVEPLPGTMAEVRSVLKHTPRVRIVSDEPNYLYAEFRTRLMRFVDDVEFYFDGEVVHVRSCSRLGHGDLGTNRRRVETLRRAVDAIRVK